MVLDAQMHTVSLTTFFLADELQERVGSTAFSIGEGLDREHYGRDENVGAVLGVLAQRGGSDVTIYGCGKKSFVAVEPDDRLEPTQEREVVRVVHGSHRRETS